MKILEGILAAAAISMGLVYFLLFVAPNADRAERRDVNERWARTQTRIHYFDRSPTPTTPPDVLRKIHVNLD